MVNTIEVSPESAIKSQELKPGVDYKVVTPKSNDPSEIRRATRQTKVNELRERYKKAKTRAEKTFILNEARQLGLVYGKNLVDPTLKVR